MKQTVFFIPVLIIIIIIIVPVLNDKVWLKWQDSNLGSFDLESCILKSVFTFYPKSPNIYG